MKFFKKARKAQESAPFELLIAVILMTFVIIAGTMALTQLRKNECERKIDKQLEEIVQSLQGVASNKGQINLIINFEGCGVDPIVKLLDESDAYRCNVFCGSQKRTCTLISYSAKDIASQIKCVNISALTEFRDQNDPGICQNKKDENFELVDWDTQPIGEGIYIISSPFNVSTTQIPTLCVYKKATI